jgi:pyridoxamine 5'-phosphate oxidase family protein
MHPATGPRRTYAELTDAEPLEARMSVFTDAERDFLGSQKLARLATASADGLPDVSAVTYALEGDTIVSGGLDITKAVRYRHLLANPRAAIVVDELAPGGGWKPRGVKVRGSAEIEEHDGKQRIRITADVIWSWGINSGADKQFATVERRNLGETQSST